MKPLPRRGYRASSQPQRPKPQGLFAVRTELHTHDREEQPDGYSGQSPLTLSALSFLESSRTLPRRHSSSYEVGDCLALRITPHSTNVFFAPAAPSDSRHAPHPQSPTSSGNEHAPPLSEAFQTPHLKASTGSLPCPIMIHVLVCIINMYFL